MAEGSEDDHTLPVLQLSSLTTTLLGAKNSDCVVDHKDACGYTRVAGSHNAAADFETLLDDAIPPTMSIRIGGSSLARPARRFRRMPCEPSSFGSEAIISEDMVKRADTEDCMGRQESPAINVDGTREQISYV